MSCTTSTRVAESFALRVAITSHRRRREDFEVLAREAVRFGAEVEGELRR